MESSNSAKGELAMTTGTEIRTEERTQFNALAQLRDEVRVQLHLAKSELRDEWTAKLEPKFKELTTKLDRFEEASTETALELRSAMKVLMDELRDGYERIRKAL